MNKEELIKKSKPAIIVMGIMVAIVLSSIVYGDNKNAKASFDGVVMTDKAGKSYMLEHSYGTKFNVVEFDMVNMRAKRN